MRILPTVAAIAAAGLLAATGCAAARPPMSTVTLATGVRFQLVAPEARSVAVAGTFNGWSITRHQLRADGAAGLWTATVALPAGEHHYMYVVDDGQWMTPPQADGYVDDGFGSQNGVVVVPPGEL